MLLVQVLLMEKLVVHYSFLIIMIIYKPLENLVVFSIFNFQFLMLRSFRTSWDDKLKWLSKLVIFTLYASIFNFLWIATKFCLTVIILHTKIATNLRFSQWQPKNNEIATSSMNSHNDSVGWVWLLPYWDCHGFFKASQWRALNNEIVTSSTKSHNYKLRTDEITIYYK